MTRDLEGFDMGNFTFLNPPKKMTTRSIAPTLSSSPEIDIEPQLFYNYMESKEKGTISPHQQNF
jgi:hypothetical protein